MHASMFNMISIQQRVEIAEILPDLHCRTHFSE